MKKILNKQKVIYRNKEYYIDLYIEYYEGGHWSNGYYYPRIIIYTKHIVKNIFNIEKIKYSFIYQLPWVIEELDSKNPAMYVDKYDNWIRITFEHYEKQILTENNIKKEYIIKRKKYKDFLKQVEDNKTFIIKS